MIFEMTKTIRKLFELNADGHTIGHCIKDTRRTDRLIALIRNGEAGQKKLVVNYFCQSS